MPRSTRSGSPSGSVEVGASGYEKSVQSRSSDTVEGPASGPVDDETQALLAERAGELALSQKLTVAVAESLTGGMIASALAAAERSSEWFLGSVVAYASQVKHDVLDVPDGPVVSATAASAMARGVRRLLKADVAVAVTGAGGPSGQDGREPGTVFVAFDGADEHRVLRLDLDDEPKIVCATSAVASLRVLIEGLEVLAGEREITDRP
jgi:nicotinamide-nucleotide amidase